MNLTKLLDRLNLCLELEGEEYIIRKRNPYMHGDVHEIVLEEVFKNYLHGLPPESRCQSGLNMLNTALE